MKLRAIVRACALAAAGAVMATTLPAQPLGPVTIGPAIASAAESACVDGWRTIDLPSPDGTTYLLAAVTDSRRPNWLLGGSHEAGSLAFQRTRNGWKRVRIRDGGTRGLTGGSALSDNGLMVSGYLNAPQYGLVGRIAGGRWTAGQLRSDTSTLTDAVVIKDKVWVVGSRQRPDRLSATALRRTNGRWKRFDAPVGKAPSALTAVEATPGGAVWAVGWRQVDGAWNRPLIVRFARKGWKAVRTASLPPGEAVLTDIHFDSGKLGWVSGYHVDAGTGRYAPILQAWDGEAWSAVELPFAEGRDLIARAVATDDTGRLWLAGAQLAAGEDEVTGWTAELRDGAWTYHLVDVPDGVPSELRALAAGRSGAVAVGSAQPGMLAIETCATQTPDEADARPESTEPGAREALATDDHDSDGATTGGLGPTRFVAQDSAAPPPFGAPVRPKRWRVKDVSKRYGMETEVKTWSGLVHDFDGNGWDDIFYSRHLKEPPRLMLADEDGLRDAPEGGFTVVDRHGCDAADLDGNGQADLFCTTGGVRGTATGRHELSMNPASETATIDRSSAGAVDPLGRGRYAAFIDHDGDGDQDLFLTTIKRRPDGLPGGNHFYENVDGRFIPAPQVGLDTAVGSKCLWSGDIDRDGDEDLINCVASPDDGRRAGVRLYRNDKGRLVDRTGGRRITPIGDIDVAVADFDDDERPDLVQLSGTRLRVSTQTDRGFVTAYEASTSDAVAIAVGDVNRDGLADIYVLRGGKTNGRDVLLVNRGGGKRFQSVRIPQTRRGDADDVLAIDFDRNGRTDFVVLNGADKPGPVQLLATLPRG